jgi:SNF2 family DNA or RNA helicase
MDQLVAYKPKLDLWAHQREALAKLLEKKNFALFMEMRTGKTATVLCEFGYLEAHGQLSDMLVIAPAGVYGVWADDIKKHFSEDLLRRAKVHVWRAGATKDERDDLRMFMMSRAPRILLMNVEALSMVKRARDLCLEFADQRKPMIVVDESTVIKNIEAKRTKFIVNTLTPKASRRRILTGLPSPQSPLDLFSQFWFLDPAIIGFPSFVGFKRRYAVIQRKPFGPRGRYIDVVVGYQNTEELAKRVAPNSFRKKLSECYDLPPKIYTKREVEMTEEQKRIYGQMKNFATAKLDETQHVTATIVITQMLRLHQILCGHTKSEDGFEVEISENRTKELLEVLDQHDRKAIIWTSYDADVKKLTKAIGERYGVDSVARFWGGNLESRDAEEVKFKTNPECRFMIGTPQAGGRGRDWSVADLVIYYSNTTNLEHRVQSEDRAHVYGKANQVLYVDLMCPGTVEEKIVAALRDKIDLATIVTGDDYREWLI